MLLCEIKGTNSKENVNCGKEIAVPTVLQECNSYFMPHPIKENNDTCKN